jgi:bifunctional non-homologous end joining protein LigD
MLATLGKPPSRFADFAVEAKYDGQRGLAVVEGGMVTLLSRNGANITRTFSEVSSALIFSGRQVISDGEIVALDEKGIPSFSPAPATLATEPPPKRSASSLGAGPVLCVRRPAA